MGHMYICLLRFCVVWIGKYLLIFGWSLLPFSSGSSSPGENSFCLSAILCSQIYIRSLNSMTCKASLIPSLKLSLQDELREDSLSYILVRQCRAHVTEKLQPEFTATHLKQIYVYIQISTCPCRVYSVICRNRRH